jgi:hypothetical protein
MSIGPMGIAPPYAASHPPYDYNNFPQQPPIPYQQQLQHETVDQLYHQQSNQLSIPSMVMQPTIKLSAQKSAQNPTTQDLLQDPAMQQQFLAFLQSSNRISLLQCYGNSAHCQKLIFVFYLKNHLTGNF